MKVSMIGGTGFVGSYITDQLIAAGHTPRLLVRSGSEHKIKQSQHCELVTGDISQREALLKTLEGTDAVIYLIGILREEPSKDITFEKLQYQGVVNTITASQTQEVKRFILMSANGVKKGGTAYQDTKARAEEALQASDRDWTIFRPSVIFGDPHGCMEFATQLQKELIKSPIPAPLFFPGISIMQAGEFKMAPVAVENVASAFVQSLEKPEMIRQIYPLCGNMALSWNDIIQKISIASGHGGKLALPVPAALIKPIAGLMERFPWFPITKGQITMLLEGNQCHSHAAFELLDIHPKQFEVKELQYLRE